MIPGKWGAKYKFQIHSWLLWLDEQVQVQFAFKCNNQNFKSVLYFLHISMAPLTFSLSWDFYDETSLLDFCYQQLCLGLVRWKGLNYTDTDSLFYLLYYIKTSCYVCYTNEYNKNNFFKCKMHTIHQSWRVYDVVTAQNSFSIYWILIFCITTMQQTKLYEF